MREGIPTSHPLLQKLWLASKVIGKISPFSPELMNLTAMQLDFILEMDILDNPDHGTFLRSGQTTLLSGAELAAAWERVLVGKANDEMMRERMPTEAVMARLREYGRYQNPKIKMGPGAK